MPTKQRPGREIGQSYRDCGEAIDDPVEVVRPAPPTSRCTKAAARKVPRMTKALAMAWGTPIAHGRSLLGMISWMQDIEAIYVTVRISGLDWKCGHVLARAFIANL